MDKQDLLIEIGTEELPPKHLTRLSEAFLDGICQGLEQAQIDYRAATPFATPRRLAVLVKGVDSAQPTQQVERKGPALKAAFDKDGNPTKAAQGFARSCGIEVSDLEQQETPKGIWLYYRAEKEGQSTTSLVPNIIEQALNRLPIAKRMRWANHDFEFVRPVHWLLVLFGSDVVEMELFGLQSDRLTFGHRFHHPEALSISQPQDYSKTLEKEGHVLPVISVRQRRIRLLAEDAAEQCDGQAVIDSDLLDEVTNLVEYPTAITGRFDDEFLQVPAEVLIASMQDHQKYFPVQDFDGNLLPYFIAMSNIDSQDPSAVQAGNERVIRPRLSDAAFFWQQDKKHPLASRAERLKQVIFQQQLGSVFDKSSRIAVQASKLAEIFGADSQLAERAGLLCKCDLNSDMVGEFPELQGIMGAYYAEAEADGEDPAVAEAIRSHYQPRFWGDELPASDLGQIISLADRLDSLVGIFGIGKAPTGDKDPFGLRRAALSVLRILLEKQRPLKLSELLDNAIAAYPQGLLAEDTAAQVQAYILERQRGYYTDNGLAAEIVNAVYACERDTPLDMQKRMVAVQHFIELPAAENLAAANKRIHNLLKKTEEAIAETVDSSLFEEAAETTLYEALDQCRPQLAKQLKTQDYTAALETLAGLGEAVDNFFDAVMVMAEDKALRQNRLALLGQLRQLFLEVADVSLL